MSRGSFVCDWELSRVTPQHLKESGDWCVYYCEDCRGAGVGHEIVHVPGPVTDGGLVFLRLLGSALVACVVMVLGCRPILWVVVGEV